VPSRWQGGKEEEKVSVSMAEKGNPKEGKGLARGTLLRGTGGREINT